MIDIIRGRTWVVAFEQAGTAAHWTDKLLERGAERVLRVVGTGTLPDADTTWSPTLILDLRPTGFLDSIRSFEAALNHPSAVLTRFLDEHDPDGEARLWCPFYLGVTEVAGRRVYGARPGPWRALEDKTVVDALWDAVGVRRAPSEVVAVDVVAIEAAMERVGRQGCAVLSGDSAGGMTGGASHVHIVRDPVSLAAAIETLAVDCRAVRVMPFLTGVPCSIHGMVVGDRVATFRPCEMLVLRSPDGGRFTYASVATVWDPGPVASDAMRAMALAVGEHLRDTLDYRGVYTIDGVLTAEGFLPTELNPRMGAAFGRLFQAGTECTSMHYAAIEGELDPQELDALQRAGRSMEGACVAASMLVATGADHALHVDTVLDEVSESDAVYTVRCSAFAGGGLIRVTATPGRVSTGPAFGPVLARLLNRVDAEWGLGLGRLVSDAGGFQQSHRRGDAWTGSPS